MITENVSTLRIHKLSQEQYDRENEAGTLEDNAIYITPDEEIPVAITTSGTGAAYTATVPNIESLVAGVSFIMIPHTVSTSTSPTLNVNGLGAQSLYRRQSNKTNSITSGYTSNWLAADIPIRVMYDGTCWIVEGQNRPVSADLSGTVSITKGGTGATTAAAALTNLGLTATATELNYVDGVTSNIQTQLDSKAASSHNHAASEITSGTLSSDRLPTVPLTKGGTGATTAAGARTNLGAMSVTNPTGTGSLSLNRASGTTVGAFSVAEGYNSTASGTCSHAEGRDTTASGICSHAEGYNLTASGDYSHAEGYNSTASGSRSHTEGFSSNEANEVCTDLTVNSTILTDWNSNKFSLAKGEASHVEGQNCLALGDYSHAEGSETIASGDYSHAEGYNSTASGSWSHTEGSGTTALGTCSHAEGYYTTASNIGTHAEGYLTKASDSFSHAEGYCTTALAFQHAQGHYNNTTTATAGVDSGTSAGTAFVIGNGTNTSPSNAFRVDYNGVPYSKSGLTTTGCDYAEFFEWQDLNSDAEDRRGYFVTLDGEQIKIANSGDYILGIISGQPSVVGNGDEDWMGRYILDDFGAFIYEEFEYEEEIPEFVKEEVVDEETGETTTVTNVVMTKVTKTGTKYKENPDYDPSLSYTQRSERPEWDYVGMLGVLSVRDDGTCQVNGYCKVAEGGIATASETGYRVIKRVNDNIVRIIFK